MKGPLFLLLLVGGGYALYRHLVPGDRLLRASTTTHLVNGRTWLLQPAMAHYDVLAPAGGALREVTFVARVNTDTNRVLSSNTSQKALVQQAMGDLGLSW